MLDRWVDSAAIDLFKELDEKLTRMSSDLDAVRQSWQQLCASDFSNGPLRREWQKNLRGLSRTANDLKGTLNQILPRIDGGEEMPNGQSEENGSVRFSEEMHTLEIWVSTAEDQMNRYFFSADQSVPVGELRGPDMSRYLDLVHELADRLARTPTTEP